MSQSNIDNALYTSSLDWVRFRRYVIEDEVIRPDLRSAMTSYDPWKAYEIARRGRAERDPPYQGLLNLLSQLRHEPTATGDLQDGSGLPVALTPDSRALLMEWCQQNGLLGILPHRARLIMLNPYWRRQVTPLERVEEEDEPYEFERLPHQNSLGLISGSWRWVRRTEARQDAEHHKDDPLTPAELPPGWPAPSAMIEDLRFGVLTLGSLRDEVWRFFPGVPEEQAETSQYPVPLSESFWQEYAEPVADFIRGAVVFSQAVKNVGARKIATRQKGLRTLHAMAGAVRVMVEPGPKGTYRQRWRSPSLLASFALMVIQDLARNRHVRQCQACHQVFAAAAYQRKYCSDRCRQRLQQRRHRARKPVPQKKVGRRHAAKRSRPSRAS